MVEIAHVAKVVDQGIQQVETKLVDSPLVWMYLSTPFRLSQMILDKILDGVLDQGRGCLLLFDQVEHDEGYADAIKMIEEVGKVVESLYGKVRRLR